MSYKPDIKAIKVSVQKRMIHLMLLDGSTHAFPADYYPLLAQATNTQLKKVKMRLGGSALRWEALDEDIWIGDAVMGRYPKLKSLQLSK
jgi:hypothetical protein